MRVALVYDRVNKWGGAERVLSSLHAIWPEAPLFTAVYDRAGAPWADSFDVRPSFLQRIPFAKAFHESLPLLTPMAFEAFSFDAYDVVISVTSAEAKSIITKPSTMHVSYCLTPTRYLWSANKQYEHNPGMGVFSAPASWGLRAFGDTVRGWDLVSASRPDYYIAISNRVKERINTYYHRAVTDVIPPPVDLQFFKKGGKNASTDGYFLTVARLVGYKKIDLIIDAFNILGLPLVVIGDGRQKRELKKRAGKNIRIIDRHLTDSELVLYYEGCRAFVYAADEDFGLAPAEAQAMGKPVIAYTRSAVSEFVKDTVSGVLFDEQTVDSLIRAVRRFATHTFRAESCRKHVARYTKKVFETSMRTKIEDLYEVYKFAMYERVGGIKKVL